MSAGLSAVEGALGSKRIQSSLFHGTGSSFLDKTQGELLSGSELANRGVKRSNEKEAFSSSASVSSASASVTTAIIPVAWPACLNE